MIIQGQIVDIINRKIFSGEIHVENQKIIKIEEKQHSVKAYIIPGFVDSHIHIESSMLVPSEFAKIAVKHGTIATISDPHEIANVLGENGIFYMIESGKKTPFKFHFGLPSCVPATNFESAGAEINAQKIKELINHKDIHFLAEVMNYPAVINEDKEILEKIYYAKKANKPIDGHAPGVLNDDLKKYVSQGIQTDHECTNIEEALQKLNLGMKILIREGSAAKNFEALADLIENNHQNLMFCSDDKHPDELLEGHINILCKRAVSKGFDIFKILQIACINPVLHYNMNVGILRKGDFADFIKVENLTDFKVLETYINGNLVAKENKSFIKEVNKEIVNLFNCNKKNIEDIKLILDSNSVNVIQAVDEKLITNHKKINLNNIINKEFKPDLNQDLLKIVVVNRYFDSKPSVAIINGFNLKKGAIASSVAHDSHNIIAVGTSDQEIINAINIIIENKGGICAFENENSWNLPLPIAGIMSDKNADFVGEKYKEIDKKAKEFGSDLKAPFMTLSFMALLVIPELKISDKGLFDSKIFNFIDIS